MKKRNFVVFSIVLLAGLWAPSPAFSEMESGTIVEDNLETVHGSVPRGTAETTDPETLSEFTDEAKQCIQRRLEKHSVDGSHPWIPPLPGGVFPVPDDARPHGPATPPVSLQEQGGLPILLHKNTDLLANSNVPAGGLGNVPEPTTVMSGNNVTYTANWVAAQSTDGGDTFTYVNPYPGPFANPVGQTFCCDQTSAFDPSTNTTFWLQQFINGPLTAGTQRINVDQNTDGTWDCHYDITAQMMGWVTGRWLDFPDLAVSSNYLWHSSNVFTSASSFDNSFAARYPLSELASCSETLSFDSKTSAYFSLQFTRGMTTTGYFGALWSNNGIRFYQWPDANPLPTLRFASTAVWQSTGTRTCAGPDGRDWCGRHDGRLQGAWVADGVLGFMWVPVQGGAFPFPYTRVARYNESDFSHIDDTDIWSPDVAYVYPSVAVNSNGDLGGTIMWGGGDTYYNNCSVFVADDVNGGALAPLDHVVSIQGLTGPQTNESGDYTQARMAYPDTNNFVGACYGNTNIYRAKPMFVHFGREVVVEPHIFSDGFESGDTSAWN